MRDVAVILGLGLLLRRVVEYRQGKYHPDWPDIAAGLLIGFAVVHIFRGDA